MVAEGVELGGGDITVDGHVASGGLQVLADGGDVGVALLAEIFEERVDFVRGLTQSDHEAGLG